MSKVYLYTRVAEELRRRAKARAAEEGVTLSEFVGRAVQAYLEKKVRHDS